MSIKTLLNMSLQVIFPSSLKSRQPSKGGWKQLTPRFIIFPCKMAIGSTTCWLENNAKSILYVFFFSKLRHQRFPFGKSPGKGHVHVNRPLVNTLDLNDFKKKNKNQLFLKWKLCRDQKCQSLRRKIKKKKNSLIPQRAFRG